MPTEMTIPKGEKTRILWLFSSSIPGVVRFDAAPVTGTELGGEIELRRRQWFSWKTETFPLKPSNTLDKGMSDADYRVYVTPTQDTHITFRTRHARAGTLFKILIGLIVLAVIAASASLIFATMQPPAP